jgi:Na+/glutamate symporter
MKLKKATWPAYAKIMFVTDRKAFANVAVVVAWMCRFGFGAAPRAIMVMRMAEVMDINANYKS